MTTVDPDQGIVLQVGTDPANLPSAQNAEFTGLLPRMNRLYANEADRTARMSVLSEGDLSHLAAEDREEIYNGVNHISLYPRTFFAYLRKGADQFVISSIVLTNIANMAVTLPAAGTFAWRALYFYNSATAADIRFGYTAPAGSTSLWGTVGLAAAAAGVTGDASFAAANPPTALTLGGAGAITIAIHEGDIVMGGTGGLLQPQFSQDVSTASNTTVYAQSRIMVWRTA